LIVIIYCDLWFCDLVCFGWVTSFDCVVVFYLVLFCFVLLLGFCFVLFVGYLLFGWCFDCCVVCCVDFVYGGLWVCFGGYII